MLDESSHTTHTATTSSWQKIMKKALLRPFALFIREPIIQLLGLYMAFVYGLLYRTFKFISE